MFKTFMTLFIVIFGGCGGAGITEVKDDFIADSNKTQIQKADPRDKKSEFEEMAAITAGDDQHVLEGSKIMLFSSRLDKSRVFTEYRWKEKETLYSTDKACYLEPLDSGEHNIILEAVDTSGKVFKDNVKVVVKSIEEGEHLPQAQELFFTTPEDTLFKGALQGSDADGDALKYLLVSLPEHGTLSGTAAHLQYIPDPDFYGEDKFFFKTNDGTIDSEYASVTIKVEPRNDAPVAQSLSFSTDEDQPLHLDLIASDKENDTLTYTIVTLPAHGTVSLSGDTVLYTPNPGFSGSDSFWYKSNDGVEDSNVAVVNIDVHHVNHVPVAVPSAVETNEDMPVDISLQANDPDTMDSLSYRLVSAPQLGSVTITGNILHYIPFTNQHGIETLHFVANDGQVDSEEATIRITINAQNDAPVANAMMIETEEDTPKDTVINANDVDGDALSFEIVQQPSHGTVTVMQNQVRYIPEINFYGTDSFTYRANDGKVYSSVATVAVDVTAVNDIPEVTAKNYSVMENNTLNITLSATDIDGDTLTYFHDSPAHGTIGGSGKDLVYTPASGYRGEDSFDYWVNDGTANSEKRSVTITVTEFPNTAPTATNIDQNLSEDGSIDITLTASDDENDSLTFAIDTFPAHGSVTLTGNVAHYIPNANYFGEDSFTFIANDSKADSNSATVTLDILPVNDMPVADANSFSINEDQLLDFTLTGSDIDGDSLTYTVSQQPVHGSLNCSGAVCQYVPEANFNGTDTLFFYVNDGSENSQEAKITIEVSVKNDAPVAFSDTYTLSEDTPLTFTLRANDEDNDTLSYIIVSQPLQGNVTISGNSVTYTPVANFYGLDRLEFKVSDGISDSNVAAIDLSITSVNDIPVADNKSVVTTEDTMVDVNLSGSDVDGDSLTYEIKNNPLHGTLSGTAPNLFYTPAENFNGTDSFSYVVADAQSESAEANVTISVTEVNDPPIANAGNDIVAPFGTNIFLDASLSSDSDGSIVSYEWREGTTSLGTTVAISKSDFSEGTHTITLTVIDDKGASATDTVIVTIEPVDTGSAFISHSVTTQASGFEWAQMIDLDKDGDLDILSASTGDSGKEIAWYQNRGDFTFIEHIIATDAANAQSVQAADFDGDDDLDIVYTAYNGTDSVVYCENDGSQNFSCNGVGNSISGLSFVAVADLDNDDKPDLITASWNNNRIDWQKNNGDGTFASPQLIDNANMNQAVHISVIDLNHDGAMDVIASANGENRIDWYSNDGSGTFTPHFIDSTIQSVYATAMGKIDADDGVDLISVSQGSGIIYWHQNSQTDTPNFLMPKQVATGLTSVYYASGVDMDNDGDIDILTNSSESNGKIVWYENIGSDTSFPEHIVVNGVDNVKRVFAADIDLDGNIDVVAGDTSGNIIVYENSADDPVTLLPKTGDSNDGAYGADANLTRDDSNEIVTDLATDLMWIDDNSVLNSSDTWSNAENTCNNMNTGSYTDWRIPTVHELYYLLDRSQNGAKINGIFNNHATDTGYWVNEHTDFTYAWIDFNNADSVTGSLLYAPQKHIRCVRGDGLVFKFIRNDNSQVVLDHKHNLMWDDTAETATTTDTWTDAKTYCSTLSTAGYTDWRLPNINELFSIATVSGVNISFRSAFVNTSESQYWSSTQNEQGDVYALEFGGEIDDVTISDTNSNLHVRCVRNIQ
jgi:hypothetical protein